MDNDRIQLTREIKIAFMPWVDKSELLDQENWPKKQQESDELIKKLHVIAKNIKRKIGRFSRLKRIKIVHQSQFPDYRLQIIFKRAEESPSGWTIPVDIEVYNQASENGNLSVSILHTARVKGLEAPNKGFFYWGQILEAYQSTFPYKEITNKLFSE